MASKLSLVVERARLAVTQPFEEMNRWQKAARWIYDFGRYGWRQLMEDDASSMAAALSFRLLFGLLPVLAVATVTAKAFIGEGEQLNKVTGWVVKLLGADGVSVNTTGAAGGTESMPLGEWIQSIVAEASRMNLAALGWIGGAVLIYSAVSLMVTIENCFNRICRAPSGRSWLKRVPLYWFVLTIGPILLGLTPYVDAKFSGAVASIESWQWAFGIAKFAWNLVIIWAFMFGVYLWVPNTTMRMRPVMVGALVAAVLLELGKRFLGAYLQNAFSASRLYGSLGLVPLFMLWVYMMWMAVLLGLEVTAMLQHLAGRRLAEMQTQKQRSRDEFVDPAGVLLVMQAIGERFVHGEPSTPPQLAEATGLPQVAIVGMLARLEARHLVHRVDGHLPEAVALARPAESITAEELMHVGWELADGAMHANAHGIVASLREAQVELARRTTLAALVQRSATA
ncbi:MAG: YihY/virulence factor BrkB family protein [Phycisphaerales bacterium]